MNFLQQRKPAPEFIVLYRKIILDVLRQSQTALVELERVARKKIKDIEERREKIADACFVQGRLDQEVYEQLDGRLKSELQNANASRTQWRTTYWLRTTWLSTRPSAG